LIAVANTKITELTQLTNPVSTDVLPIVDVGADVTKKISIADLLKNASTGTADAPGIAFDGRSRNGIYSPGADQVAISTNGTGRLFVDASGNVGLNASTPNNYGAGYNVFTVNGSTSPVIDLNVGGTRTATFYAFSTNTLIGTQTSTPLQIVTNGTEKARITSDGKLGLGTSSPGAKLHVGTASETGIWSGFFGNNLAGSVAPPENYGLTFGYNYTNGNGEANIVYGTGTGSGPGLVFASYDGTTYANRMLLDGSGRVGIGSNNPDSDLHLLKSSGGDVNVVLKVENSTTGQAQLHISAGSGATNRAARVNFYNRVSSTSTPRWSIINDIGQNGTNGLSIVNAAGNTALNISQARTATFTADASNAPFIANIGASEVARIDSFGRLVVGASSSISGGDAQYARLQIVSNTTATNSGALLTLARGAASSFSSGDLIGGFEFTDNAGGAFARIQAVADGTSASADFPGRLVFSTTADGASSPTERARITSGGYFKASNSGVYNAAAGTYHEVYQTASDIDILARATNASYASNAIVSAVDRSANSAYAFLLAISNYATAADTEFNLRGDGSGFCDGSWTGGGADYAEYFEWSDGNPDADDRRGISVVLDGDKIRPALPNEDPIGVISGNPSVVGDAAWNKWSGKYLRDDFGTYIQEDYEVVNDEGETVVQQRRKLNPAYDPDVEYTSREERLEWDCVGLMGKLRIRKGQPTGSRWIKMRDISDSVEEWLVR
jgi:hypothetical protein